MELENSEFALSGYTLKSLREGLEALMHLDNDYHLWRLVVTSDGAPKPSVIICDPGTSIHDFDEVVSFDLTLVKSISAEYNALKEGPVARVMLTRRSSRVDIDGHLPVSGSIRSTAEVTPGKIFMAYCDFTVKVASILGAEVLAMANEYCEDVIEPVGVTRPSILVVLADEVARANAEELERTGAVIDPSTSGAKRVWLQNPENFTLGAEEGSLARRAVEDLLRSLG